MNYVYAKIGTTNSGQCEVCNKSFTIKDKKYVAYEEFGFLVFAHKNCFEKDNEITITKKVQ